MINETISALFTFALVSSITPGPNNIMLMTSGTNFGFRKTIPHILGVSIGFTVMIILVGFGLVQLFNIFTFLNKFLQIISVLYLLILAHRIATSSSKTEDKNEKSKPMSFMEAAIFQWVNPKAWTMALTSISLYSQSKSVDDVLKIAIVFGAVNLPSVSTWAFAGQQFRRLLSSELRLRTFNFLMAFFLISSLYYVLFPE